MKTCTKCGATKPLDNFPNEARRSDGKYPWCRPCLSKHRKDRYEKRDRKFWITNKVCPRCKRDLPREQFRKFYQGTLHTWCVECEDEVTFFEANGFYQCGSCMEWKSTTEFYPSKRHKHRSQCIACGKSYHVDNKDAIRNRSLQKYFGITLEQYKELLFIQNGKCPVCLKRFEEGNFSYPVDHAHTGPHRGRIRAIVHDECNRFVLWLHEDGAQLRAAARLIENPLTEWVVPEPWINADRAAKRR
jgi:hypothetical protein